MWIDGLRGVWRLLLQVSSTLFSLCLLAELVKFLTIPKSKKNYVCWPPNHPPSWGLQVSVVSQPCTWLLACHKPSKVTAPSPECFPDHQTATSTDSLRLASSSCFQHFIMWLFIASFSPGEGQLQAECCLFCLLCWTRRSGI